MKKNINIFQKMCRNFKMFVSQIKILPYCFSRGRVTRVCSLTILQQQIKKMMTVKEKKFQLNSGIFTFPVVATSFLNHLILLEKRQQPFSDTT